jgi:hypothetical protein
MKIFKGNKWNQWWDSLPENYKVYLENQGQHYEKTSYLDIGLAVLVGFVLGIGVGLWLSFK